MLPSRAYVGRSVSQASVDGTPCAQPGRWRSASSPTSRCRTWPCPCRPWCTPARRERRASRPEQRGWERRPVARQRRGCARTPVRRLHRRECLGRNAEQVAQLIRPVEVQHVVQQGPRGIAGLARIAATAVSRHTSQASTVPRHTSDLGTSSRWSSSQRNFGPENMASIRRPVRARTGRRLPEGQPRTPRCRAAVLPADDRANRLAGASPPPDDRLPLVGDGHPGQGRVRGRFPTGRYGGQHARPDLPASCSIHPGRGEARPTGAAPYPTTCPSSATPMALELVVPWSIDRIMAHLLAQRYQPRHEDLTSGL